MLQPAVKLTRNFAAPPTLLTLFKDMTNHRVFCHALPPCMTELTQTMREKS